jgi:hypothetical protein
MLSDFSNLLASPIAVDVGLGPGLLTPTEAAREARELGRDLVQVHPHVWFRGYQWLIEMGEFPWNARGIAARQSFAEENVAAAMECPGASDGRVMVGHDEMGERLGLTCRYRAKNVARKYVEFLKLGLMLRPEVGSVQLDPATGRRRFRRSEYVLVLPRMVRDVVDPRVDHCPDPVLEADSVGSGEPVAGAEAGRVDKFCPHLRENKQVLENSLNARARRDVGEIWDKNQPTRTRKQRRRLIKRFRQENSLAARASIGAWEVELRAWLQSGATLADVNRVFDFDPGGDQWRLWDTKSPVKAFRWRFSQFDFDPVARRRQGDLERDARIAAQIAGRDDESHRIQMSAETRRLLHANRTPTTAEVTSRHRRTAAAGVCLVSERDRQLAALEALMAEVETSR